MKSCKDCLHYEVCADVMKQQLYIKDILCGHKNPVCPQFADRFEWVHLPCKVGDSIFCDGELFADRYAGEVMKFTAEIVRTQVCTTHCGEIDMIFNFNDFGKTVFLTREEAEKALKEYEINESL